MNKKRTKSITIAGALITLLLLVVAGCGGGGGGGGGTPAASTVEVVNCASVVSSATVTATGANAFSPSNVTIPVNGVVEWESESSTNHTVTSGTDGSQAGDGTFNQPLNAVSVGGTPVCLKFTAAGTFNYYCYFHFAMGMKGTVTVH